MDLWCTDVGHIRPPLRGGDSTRSSLFIEPRPQVREHADQPPVISYLQSTGHANSLQPRVSPVCGHCTPPYALFTSTARERRWFPSHEAEHAPQVDQCPTAQSAGQLRGWVASLWM